MKDLNEAEQRGWEIAPHVEVRKGAHVVRGTHEEVVKRISELERVEEMEAERRAVHAVLNSPVTALVRRFRACAREYGLQSDRYHASIDQEGHASSAGLKALDGMNVQLKRLIETFEELLRQPKELLLTNPDFRELQARLPT
jgi:hypothetical protein